MFEVHCAELVHAVPLGAEQVLREALHAPVAHTAAAVAAEQVPSWRPSFGIATPAASLLTQVNALRSQNWPDPQSASPKHAPGVDGMHEPAELQTPVVQSAAAFCGVHGPSPGSYPQVPFEPHTPEAQTVAAFAALQEP